MKSKNLNWILVLLLVFFINSCICYSSNTNNKLSVRNFVLAYPIGDGYIALRGTPSNGAVRD